MAGEMVDKTLKTCEEAVARVFDGATILLGGFGDPGLPGQLLEALRRQGAKNLTMVHNGAGGGTHSLGGLIHDGKVRKLIASFPSNPGNQSFQEKYLKGEVELELVPQGTLAERIRAAGAGLGGFFTPTGAGTDLAAGKESARIDGRENDFRESRCTPTSPSSAPIAATASATSTTAWPCATSMCRCARPPSTSSRKSTSWFPSAASIPKMSTRPGIFVNHVVEVVRIPEYMVITTEGR